MSIRKFGEYDICKKTRLKIKENDDDFYNRKRGYREIYLLNGEDENDNSQFIIMVFEDFDGVEGYGTVKLVDVTDLIDTIPKKLRDIDLSRYIHHCPTDEIPVDDYYDTYRDDEEEPDSLCKTIPICESLLSPNED